MGLKKKKLKCYPRLFWKELERGANCLLRLKDGKDTIHRILKEKSLLCAISVMAHVDRGTVSEYVSVSPAVLSVIGGDSGGTPLLQD